MSWWRKEEDADVVSQEKCVSLCHECFGSVGWHTSANITSKRHEQVLENFETKKDFRQRSELVQLSLVDSRSASQWCMKHRARRECVRGMYSRLYIDTGTHQHKRKTRTVANTEFRKHKVTVAATWQAKIKSCSTTCWHNKKSLRNLWCKRASTTESWAIT